MNVLSVREPATQRWLGELPVPSAEQVVRSVEQARTAQHDWQRRGATERCALIRAWRDELGSSRVRLVELLARENGKPLHEARLGDLIPLLDALSFVADQAPEVLRSRSVELRWQKHRSALVQYRPRGVTAVLAPFNFPLLIPVSEAAWALAAGCAVILKPSEHTPLVARQAVELAWSVGIPKDVLQLLPGGPEIGSQLIEAGVAQVRFTGSISNGRRLAERCAASLIPCTLELGGNAPLVVDLDADLDRAAKAIAVGALHNSGQSCFAVGRVFVPRAQQSELAERLHAELASLRQGDPMSGSVDLGALTTALQVQRAKLGVKQAGAVGARLVCGGVAPEGPGHFFRPTLLVDCPADCDAVVQELFGPVIPLVPYDRREQVFDWANLGPHGLAAYVFGNDPTELHRIASHLDAAHVLVDDVLSSYACPELPLAPRKHSGLGVIHATEGLLSQTTATVLGLPRYSLPTSVQFGWLRADAVHHLASRLATMGFATRRFWQKLRGPPGGS